MSERYKHIPRDSEELKNLKNRLHRMMGQLNGIEKMLDEGRYCMDILIQISALESALQSLGYRILHDHLETCVREKVQNNDKEVMDEVMTLIKKLK
ncbi:metal-sensing transcriptional repressor [uncultured Faecalicoccus sp.]|uniref:metal-sensing transcriptional repressor n=1 Tax=uncultured Faecalicoccus sp. TaxID=1971760 RepID=UPI00260D45CD|nr:metal-sensing transcriptional repressor [uncultured Faecalicoccus sp.]